MLNPAVLFYNLHNMIKYTLKVNSRGKILKILAENINGVNYSALAAALRKKDVLINGERISENVSAEKGAKLTVFLPDSAIKSDFSVFYEDDNLLVVNKNKGIEVCNGSYNIADELKKEGKNVLPVHRLDRNTSGLCMFCKNETAFKLIITALRESRIRKVYRAETAFAPERKQGVFIDYMIKNAAKSLVTVTEKPVPGAEKTVTYYKLFKKTPHGALLDIEISGGFTHQIRASLAFHGIPVLGDGKYGNGGINRSAGYKYQRLAAYKLIFGFPESSPLFYLNATPLTIPEKNIRL